MRSVAVKDISGEFESFKSSPFSHFSQQCPEFKETKQKQVGATSIKDKNSLEIAKTMLGYVFKKVNRQKCWFFDYLQNLQKFILSSNNTCKRVLLNLSKKVVGARMVSC